MTKRVVVTGMGALTPLGNSVGEYWDGLVNGRSGITRVTRFDPDDYASQIGGEVKGFDPKDYMDRKEAKRMGEADGSLRPVWGCCSGARPGGRRSEGQ